jgi:hypothetical protein
VIDDKGQVIQGPQPDVRAVNDVAAFGVVRDSFWPRSMLTWLILTAIFLLISIQFVSPTRRWHLRRRGAPSQRAGALW